jgi:short-subunit dehydrogenase
MNNHKVIWITGASSGIGKSLAIEFLENNFIVIGTARRIELLNELKIQLGEKGKYFEPFKLDLSNSSSILKFYSEISKQHKIDCLINNAGLTSFNKSYDDSIEDIESIINVNLLGSISAIKAVLPEMMEKKSGTIINILSVVTQKLFTASSAYSASKAGLMAYTNVLREEVRDKNIRVINVSPGATATSIWPEKVLNQHSERMMEPKQLANLIFKIYSEKGNLVVENIFVRPITGDL